MLIVQRRRLLYPAYVQDYLDRVTAADRAAGDLSGLELGVTDAFNTTLQNMVSDNVLGISGGVIAQAASIIKAMPFMCGARTLQGCLIPVVGPAPTNFNFVAGDYNRKTGLKGRPAGNTYLNTNRNNNADPQNSNHNAVYVTTAGTSTTYYMGCGVTSTETGTNNFGRSTQIFFRNRGSAAAVYDFSTTAATGLIGSSRASSSSFSVRANGSSGTTTLASATPLNSNVCVFDINNTIYKTDARIAFYSIGEAVDLALLDTRVTALINALAAAIP